jgi:hypothetical protein
MRTFVCLALFFVVGLIAGHFVQPDPTFAPHHHVVRLRP